jgi:hypothetical protein
MENLLPLVVFAVIVLFSLFSKLRKKTDEESPSPPAETPELEDLPEILRRLFTGQSVVPKARPAAPKEGDAAKPITIVPAQRREMPYQPPVARPAAPRPSPTPAPTMRPVARPVAQPLQRPVAKPAPTAMMDDEGPRRRPAGMAPPLRPLLRERKPLAAPAPKVRAPQPAATPQSVAAKQERAAATARKALPHYEFLRNLDDVRRGIILSELLGPPLSLR